MVRKSALENFGEVGVALDGDQGGVRFESPDDLVGDRPGAGTQFHNDFHLLPVDLLDGGFGQMGGRGPYGGDLGAVAEELGKEEEIFGNAGLGGVMAFFV